MQADALATTRTLVSDHPSNGFRPQGSPGEAAKGALWTVACQVFTLFDISARFVTHIRCGLHHGNIQADVRSSIACGFRANWSSGHPRETSRAVDPLAIEFFSGPSLAAHGLLQASRLPDNGFQICQCERNLNLTLTPYKS